MDHILSYARPDMITTASGSENMVDLILNLSPRMCLQETNRYPTPLFMCKINCMPIKMQ